MKGGGLARGATLQHLKGRAVDCQAVEVKSRRDRQAVNAVATDPNTGKRSGQGARLELFTCEPSRGQGAAQSVKVKPMSGDRHGQA